MSSENTLGYHLDKMDKELLVEISFGPLKQYQLSGAKSIRVHDLKRMGLLTYDGRWKTTRQGELVVEEILLEKEFTKDG